MRRFLPIILLSLVPAAAPARAQALLPSSFGSWTASDSGAYLPSARVDQITGADTPIFREYSVQSAERKTYTQGSQNVSVTLYRLRDPSSAYGAYTFLRSDNLGPVSLGSFGCAARDRALIVVGNLLLDISGQETRPPDTDLKLLAEGLSRKADLSPYPTIGGHLPDQGRVRRSEHYVLGPRSLARYLPLGTDDWIGFDHSAEVIVSRYQLAGQDATLMIASYPTQQIAADKFDGMLRRFAFDPPGPPPAGQKVLFGKRVSSMVAIVVDAPSRAAANALLDQIGYESQVTWNEPKQSYSDPTISSIVVGAILGTGSIMLLAVAAGLGFGGVRLLFKIFLPNKVFDREKHVEILQLGISSKPIQAKDFY
jgi:uncharacterized protein DUF6599